MGRLARVRIQTSTGTTQLIALNHILVPTNLGEPSKAALRYGVAFARQFNAKLYVVHVLAQEDYDSAIETERVIEELLPEAANTAPGSNDGSPQSLERNAAYDELAELLSPEDREATRAEFVIRAATGHPGDTIIDCVSEFDVELLVLGRHRERFVEHLLARSVTRKVVRYAPCPVLVVHYPQQEFVVDDGAAD